MDGTNIYIDSDGSGNMTFTDSVVGTITLEELGTLPHKYIKATSQSEGDLHLSDGTTWNVSKAMISIVRVVTSSTDWDLYLLQNDNGFAADDATIPKFQIMADGDGSANILVNVPYEDEDASDEVHIYYIDNTGSNTADFYIIGYALVGSVSGGGGGSGDITDVGDSSSGASFTADGTGNTLYFEGPTADANETIIVGRDNSTDFTHTIPLCKAKMTRDAAQTINNATFDKILFDTEEFDIGSFASTVDANFVIAEAGQYLVTGYLEMPGIDNSEFLLIAIYINGTASCWTRAYCTQTNGDVATSVTDVYDLSASDYVEMYVYQNSGDAQDTYTDAANPERKPRMTVVKLF